MQFSVATDSLLIYFQDNSVLHQRTEEKYILDHGFTAVNIFEQVTQMSCFDLLQMFLHKRMTDMNH
jgi:hypothetical protein